VRTRDSVVSRVAEGSAARATVQAINIIASIA
jgi:hypothetical protein